MSLNAASPPDPPFGFLICDKPVGITSRDAVNIVAKRFRETRVLDSDAGSSRPSKLKLGHAGTLDPLAQGVLVIGVGRAVRLISHVQRQPKHYRSTFLLGQQTPSGDLEVPPTVHGELPVPPIADLLQAAQELTGTIEQTPPAHSAIKIDGRRAYERVRAGEQFEMPSRQVEIHTLEVTRYEFPEMDFETVCGSGTYIRTLGMDLAKATGTVAVMKSLNRLGVGKFTLEAAFSIDEIRKGDPHSMMVPALWAVVDLPTFAIDDEQATRLVHGLDLKIELVPTEVGDRLRASSESAAVWRGELFAILRPRGGNLWPERVFPRAGVPSRRPSSE